MPRAFCTPGKRIRLHPDDYFPLGHGRGGIDERWLASSIRADNGPQTGAHEGLSLVVDPDGGLLPFDEFIDHHKGEVIGSRLWDAFGGWTMYSKFYDNLMPLPFHVHHSDEKAALVDKVGKPEAYYYSPHMNDNLGMQPISFFGFQPGITKDQVKERLKRFENGGDNRITDLALGYRTQLGTGWDIPAGVLHAPASICTYEPQAASDVFAMCESWSNNREVPEELLWKDVPAEHHGDYDFIIDLLDWEKNVDVDFVGNRFMVPYATATSEADGGSALRREVDRLPLRLLQRQGAHRASPARPSPSRTRTPTARCFVQGGGTFGGHDAQAATLIRFGQLSQDEFFVSETRREGRRHDHATAARPTTS